ncbi:MAG: alpha/beta hydrolase [Actinomycetota bacterium]|nr:alpha/beta hydrolase [Actinomycetota bacterium]
MSPEGAVRSPTIRRGYVDVPWGQLHYARCGEGAGPPVVLAHQTPRSWDEYRDVLPLLGREFDTVAADTAGFGASDLDPGAGDSIEHYAEGLTLLIEALGLERVALVGHHTGALVVLEVAVQAPTEVRAVVLSSAPLETPEERAAALGRRGVDEVQERPDGSHLTELWSRRSGFYPPDRPDLLHRFVTDALKVGDRVEEGHRACSRYDTSTRAERLREAGTPTLVLAGTADPFAYPMLARWREMLPAAELVEIATGMVPLPDQLPAAFAAAVSTFLRGVDAGGH